MTIERLEQTRCVYCGTELKVMSYDHFIPQSIIRVVEKEKGLSLYNWLLPCCQSCNQIARNYFFPTFVKKFVFVVHHNQSGWNIYDNPQAEILYNVRVQAALTSLIRPISELTTQQFYLIIVPKVVNDTWLTGYGEEHFIDISDSCMRSQVLDPRAEPGVGHLSGRETDELLPWTIP